MAKETAPKGKVMWPAFKFNSTSHRNLSLGIDPESGKWALYDTDKKGDNKMVTRRKSIVSLSEATNEYVANGGATATKAAADKAEKGKVK